MSQSRKQRIQERVEKHRRNRRILTLLVATALIAIIVSAVYLATRPTLAGAFPFPCLGLEGTTVHVHPWLRIVINNQIVSIPALIGIVSTPISACFEPIHTHDNSGIIHVESDNTNQAYTLGNFFTIWNVTYGTVSFINFQRPIIFNQTDILGFKNDSTHHVRLLVDNTTSPQYTSLNLVQYDYCNSANANVSPCNPTASGNPAYPNGYPYGMGHTVMIEY